jgi:BioD-like phosphotransacetylase family protein
MRPLFVSSTGNLAGQSLVAWHLLRRLAERRLSPGFYKPLGRVDETTPVDPDVALFTHLFDLPETPDALCPFTLQGYRDHAPEFTDAGFLDQVGARFDAVSGAHAAMVVLGSSDIFAAPDFLGLPDHRFIERLGARVVLVDRFVSESMTVYSALAVGSFLGDRLRAIVINRVPPEAEPRLRAKLAPLVRARPGTQVVTVPEDRVIAAHPVADYVETLGGRVLATPTGASRLVAESTIGSSPLQGPMRLLRRIPGKILLLGGTAAQLADPGFAPAPCGVLLPGGRLPADAVVAACETAGVTLIVVPLDAFAVLDRLERQRFELSPAHAYKVERLETLLGGGLDPDRLLAE